MAAKKICFVYATEAEDMALYKDLSPHFAIYARKGLLEVIDRDAVFKRHADPKKLADYINDSDITIPLISIHLLNDPECLDWLQKYKLFCFNPAIGNLKINLRSLSLACCRPTANRCWNRWMIPAKKKKYSASLPFV
jgi:hypothetical protein